MIAPTAIGRSAARERPIGGWAFTGVAVASLGGPLAIAGLIAPAVIGDASPSAGLSALASLVAFAVPLAVWLRYSAHVGGPGGLYAYVEAAAGRHVARVQAAVWTISYLLYIVDTTVQIVYDLLPSVLPGEARLQTPLALLIPVAIVAVMVAGRTAALLVIGLVAAVQVVLGGVLDGVTLTHLSTPVATLGAGAGAGEVSRAGLQVSLLYVCASLPLFLGGELAHPARTIRRGLLGGFAVTGILVGLAVAPLAAAPGLAHTEVPGVAVVTQFAGASLARTIGIGVALSVAGVILAEYLALTRLLSAVGGWRTRPVTLVVGAMVLAAAPLTLLDPDGFYDALARPSLVALWVSQLIVFAVFPRFAMHRGARPLTAWTLGLAASAFAVYGLYNAIAHVSS